MCTKKIHDRVRLWRMTPKPCTCHDASSRWMLSQNATITSWHGVYIMPSRNKNPICGIYPTVAIKLRHTISGKGDLARPYTLIYQEEDIPGMQLPGIRSHGHRLCIAKENRATNTSAQILKKKSSTCGSSLWIKYQVCKTCGLDEKLEAR